MAMDLARWWMTVNPIALGHSHCGQVGGIGILRGGGEEETAAAAG